MIREPLQANNIQKGLIEASLFISTKPVHINELMKITGIASLGYLKDILKDLQKDYFERGLEIAETPEGWQMQVKKEYLPQVSNLTPHYDLSEGCKKTLALVIYKEPLKQSDLIKMQGTKAYVYVKELVKKNLLRGERSGHTKILKVTSDFEQYFGESKASIRERILNSLEGGADLSVEKEPTKDKEPLESAHVEIPIDNTVEEVVTEKIDMENKNLKPIKRARPVKVKLP